MGLEALAGLVGGLTLLGFVVDGVEGRLERGVVEVLRF